MTEAFVIADTHFGHERILEFECRKALWDDIWQHDADIVERWNETVRPKDIVYHLGDVALCPDHDYILRLLSDLNGTKILVAGNHDAPWVYPAFDKVFGVRERKRVVLSHIPVHPGQKERFRMNIHGHLHENVVKREYRDHGATTLIEDGWYVCVSCEQVDFRPQRIRAIMETRDTLWGGVRR